MIEASGGPKPDWEAEFLVRNPKDKGNRAVQYGDSLTREEMVPLIKLLVHEGLNKILPEAQRPEFKSIFALKW
jgi:hypothetical protein